MTTAHLSSSEFTRRFVALVLSSRELPRKPRALHVLLVSAVLGFQPGGVYSERQVNEELQKWVLSFGSIIGLDAVTLRRLLVDVGLLRRDPAGSSYQLETDGGITFDPSIREIDLHALMADERRSREKRKRAYLEEPNTR